MRHHISLLLLAMNLAMPVMLSAAPPSAEDAAARAARSARENYGGRVLSVTPERGDAQQPPGYRVKLLREGEVRIIRVPSRNDKGSKGRPGGQRARPRR
ncbi:MAG: hypothetical protein ABFS23_03870 [Pseudomonadota bacterium]